MVETPTLKIVWYEGEITFLPGDNRRRVPQQSPSLDERDRQTERSSEGSVT